MLETGQILKQGREKQNLSVQEVALNTKINPRVIKAIETGETENLPPKSFLRGFVKTYAEYLKLDVDAVLDSFQKEMGSTLHQPKPNSSDGHSSVKSLSITQSITTKTLVVIGIVVLITIILMVRQLVEKYEKDRITPEIPEKVAELQPESKKENSAALLVKKEEPSTAEKVQENIKKISKNESSKSEESAAEKQKPIVKKTKPEPEPEPEKITQKQEETPKPEKPEETPKAKTAIKTQGPHELIIEALDSVTIKFYIDDQSLKTITLRPDETHIIKAKNKISLTVSDGGMANIIHNGKDRGVPGVLGKPHTIKFN